jgi:hypothetical protein
MNDLDIRLELRGELQRQFAQDPGTKIIEELGICQGAARIDLAVANCALHGFEIKSAVDNLQRLPFQEQLYSRVFDSVTLVTAGKHLDLIAGKIPHWWGLIAARPGECEAINLITVRESLQNPAVDPYCLAQLLWKEEALEILVRLGKARGVKSKPREAAWRLLVESVTVEHLKDLVRNRLKVREGWRSA